MQLKYIRGIDGARLVPTKFPQNTQAVDKPEVDKLDGKVRDSWCIKVESQTCSAKQSLIGLHEEVMSLSTDDQQIYVSSTAEIFFSSVPDGHFNLVTSFTDLEEFGRPHCAIHSKELSKAHWERKLHLRDPESEAI